MEEGEAQIFFPIAKIISFLGRNSSQVNQNNRTLLGPYYGYQLARLPRLRNSLLAHYFRGYYLSSSTFNIF